ncbi:MAG: AcrR family transcriptional regulator [Candidatus Azotimanducaceae bacterium]|jgi:AcrR family transcriptional regulator|tara:strand:+ start:4643 stop:5251 length:609 start_codon:yes stop_codon:yes gene_type:complete
MESGAVDNDGRRMRRNRNRQQVIDTYIDLMDNGVLEPTRDELTAASGISGRSIYRYFPDDGALISAVADHIIQRFGPGLADDDNESGTLSDRILAFVARRLRVYELTAPITRTARTLGANDANVVRAFRLVRDGDRLHLGEQFSPELEQLDEGPREELITMLHTPFLFGSMEYAHGVHEDRDAVARMLQLHMHRHLQVQRPA